MLIIILQWIYLLAVAFCLGCAFSCFVEKFLNYRIKRAESLFLTGMMILNVYAQVFSLFYKVGAAANVILLAAAAVIAIGLRKQLGQYLTEQWRSCSALRKIIILLLFLLWAFYTSRGYMAYDTGLYHGQSIRWIEEYGVVKGLGNLHERFAYNSSIFAFYALFSMKFLTGGFSLHTINGLFAFVICLPVLDIAQAWKRKKMLLSDYARAGAAYYLTTICDEVISPSSDYAVMCLIFYIVIMWLSLLEENKESFSAENFSIVPYSLLCVAGVYTLTLKLTAGLILLLLIKPAAYLLKNKKWKDIGLYLLMGILVAAPWMARSVIISGWLIYPLPSLDLFSVDWKMPVQNIPIDAAQIKTWGRALYNAALVDVPITEWFPNWFRTTLLSTEKLLILADLASVVIFVILLLWTLIRKKRQNLDFLLVLGTVACSYGYWQNSAPLMRYGYAYVLLLAGLTAGWIVLQLGRDGILRLLILLFALYKLTWLTRYTLGCAQLPNYIWQEDYEEFEVEPYEVGGEIFYKPVCNDRTGYYVFPASPTEALIELRGEGFEDGFRSIQTF